MAANTMVVRPAAGPDTDSADRLMAPTTTPPTMPATSPEISGAPDASATPRHKGNATSATTTDAGTSCRQLASRPVFSCMRSLINYNQAMNSSSLQHFIITEPQCRWRLAWGRRIRH